MPLAMYGQVSYDFESGGSTGWVYNFPGRWVIDNNSPISGLWSLHHAYDNSEAGCDIAAIDISTLRSDLDTITWQFSIRHGYDPSSSNNWGIYLAADGEVITMMPGADASGFIAGVNMTGYDDTLRIWRTDGGNLEKVVTTEINWQNDVGTQGKAFIKITRTPGGHWTFSVGVDGAEPSAVGEGQDSNWFTSRWFGICYRYTSTRDQLLWFDDLLIDGAFIADTLSPIVKAARFISGSSILLEFDEPVSSGLLVPSNFRMEEIDLFPYRVISDGYNRVQLSFDPLFENKTEYRLSVNSLCDNHNNCDETIIIPILLAVPEWGDIVITEFMADPDPAVHLPACEYIEVYNRTQFDFNLESTFLFIGSRKVNMPFFNLSHGMYLAICDDNCDWTGTDAPFILQVNGFPAIVNGGADIFLTDTAGNSLHGLSYTDKWQDDVLKSDGGWSMEMLDIGYPFHETGNWKYSNSNNGGTPGAANSVSASNPDYTDPWLDNVFPLDDTLVRVDFSEPVDISVAEEGEWVIENLKVGAVDEHGFMRKSFIICTGDKINSETIYELEVPQQVRDYNNNPLARRSLGFGVPVIPLVNELVINEILFDALPWESEYIELYNNSEHVINASDLFMVSVNSHTGDTGKPVWFSIENRCIMPGDYYVITTRKEGIAEKYYSSDPYYIFEVPSLPSLPDDGGTLILFTREASLIDRVTYSKDMHFDLLAGTEGVSLERVSPNALSGSRTSWHSASGTSGWGTPGVKNSICMDESRADNPVSLSSRKISPDNDGYEDILKITVTMENPGYIIRCSIFDDRGYPVRDITGNITAGIISELFWDGTSDEGFLLPGGIYIILVKVTGNNGEVSAIKKVCAIVR